MTEPKVDRNGETYDEGIARLKAEAEKFDLDKEELSYKKTIEEIIKEVLGGKSVEEIKIYTEVAKPFVGMGIDILFEFTPYLGRIIEAMVDTGADMRIRAIKRYTDADFTKEEAMLLSLGSNKDVAGGLSALVKGISDLRTIK